MTRNNNRRAARSVSARDQLSDIEDTAREKSGGLSLILKKPTQRQERGRLSSNEGTFGPWRPAGQKVLLHEKHGAEGTTEEGDAGHANILMRPAHSDRGNSCSPARMQGKSSSGQMALPQRSLERPFVQVLPPPPPLQLQQVRPASPGVTGPTHPVHLSSIDTAQENQRRRRPAPTRAQKHAAPTEHRQEPDQQARRCSRDIQHQHVSAEHLATDVCAPAHRAKQPDVSSGAHAAMVQVSSAHGSEASWLHTGGLVDMPQQDKHQGPAADMQATVVHATKKQKPRREPVLALEDSSRRKGPTSTTASNSKSASFKSTKRGARPNYSVLFDASGAALNEECLPASMYVSRAALASKPTAALATDGLSAGLQSRFLGAPNRLHAQVLPDSSITTTPISTGSHGYAAKYSKRQAMHQASSSGGAEQEQLGTAATDTDPAGCGYTLRPASPVPRSDANKLSQTSRSLTPQPARPAANQLVDAFVTPVAVSKTAAHHAPTPKMANRSPAAPPSVASASGSTTKAGPADIEAAAYVAVLATDPTAHPADVATAAGLIQPGKPVEVERLLQVPGQPHSHIKVQIATRSSTGASGHRSLSRAAVFEAMAVSPASAGRPTGGIGRSLGIPHQLLEVSSFAYHKHKTIFWMLAQGKCPGWC